MRLTSLALLATVTAVPGVAQAQQQSPAAGSGGTSVGAKVAIRSLGATVATSADSLGFVAGVRALPGGGVLVNDVQRRRVVRLDASLASPMVVVDSTSGAENSYGPRPGGLIPYRGDSTLFVDPASLSMLVIDAAGKVGRVMSVPRSDDAQALASAAFGAPGFDAQGRLIYRGTPRLTMRGGPPVPGARAGGSPMVMHGGAGGAMPTPPDTMPIVRIDLATRALDTLAWVKVPRPSISMTQGEDGRMEVKMVMNPLPTVDEWAVTSEGAIAIVRGRDYHVDWINPDGSRSSSPKVAFDWKRMTDEDKEAFIDSLKAQRARQGPNAATPLVPGMPTPGAGAPVQMQMRIESSAPGGPVGGRQEIRTAGASNFEFVPASELPDYRPPFFAGAVRPDRDGNLWIRTTSTPTVANATVYDVVDRRGTVIDRVQVPSTRAIVGFGTDGTVILAAREGTVTRLEKAKLR